MKNVELFKLQQNLGNVKNLKGERLNYAIIKNRRIIDSAIKDLRGKLKFIPEYSEYKRKSTLIGTEHQEELKKLKPNADDEKRSILVKKFKKDSTDLEKEYKEIIDKANVEQEKWNKLLEEEISNAILFYKIKREWIPADIVTEDEELFFDFIEGVETE